VRRAPRDRKRRPSHAGQAPSAAELEPIETASRDELSRAAIGRLKQTLAHAYEHVPHYRRKFDARASSRAISKSLADLAQFPFTTKQDLRDNYPFGMFAVPREKVVRIHASSGNTGKPTVVGYTAKDIDTWATVMARSIRAAGGRAGDIITSPTVTACSPAGSARITAPKSSAPPSFPMSGGMTERQVQLIADFRPDIIMVTPSYMLAIAEEMERRASIRAFIAQGRHLRRGAVDPAMRAAIEAKADMDAIDIYGLSKSSAPAFAQECIETKDGLTVWEDHFYPEVIDPESGACLRGRREGRARLYHAHQGSAAHDPLSHARSDAAVAADRALDAAHREDHWAQR
jgi:phenylacetate-CoA ligase